MNTDTKHIYTPEQVIRFWFGGSDDDIDQVRAQGAVWYSFSPERDAEITEKFGDLLKEIVDGKREDWGETSVGALALVLVLDQFSRQIYRKQAEAFAYDQQALAIAYSAVNNGLDQDLSVAGRLFLYHPFQHSEALKDQEFGVAITRKLQTQCEPHWQEYVEQSLSYFQEHCEIIERFGRFPHRNEVLNRKSRPEEVAYLKTASRYGQ